MIRISRRGIFAILTGWTAVVISGFALTSEAQTPDAFKLTILHTNDLHGHIYPFAYTEIGRSKEEKASVGGAARRATLVRDLRKNIKNPVILVDSGDTFTRGPLTNFYEGVADVEAMNAVGYEVGALGNNEFKAKDGIEVEDAAGAQAALLQVVKRAKFPWLCANATDSNGATLQGVQPYIVRQIEGVRVGFLGLTAPRSAKYPQVKGWKILDPIATAKAWIPRARKECDILIAMTHIGVDLDKELASKTTGLDAIVGGDSHTFLYKLEEVANPEGVKIPIVQDGEFGVNLGRFDLSFHRSSDGKWSLSEYRDVLIPVSAKLKEASDVVRTLAPFRAPYDSVIGRFNQPIAASPEERDLQTTKTICDAMRSETNSDFAINNVGDGLFEVFRHADVTLYEVHAIMPFKNHVVRVKLTGVELRKLIADPKKTAVSGDASAISEDGNYTVAMVDFSAQSAFNISPEKRTDTDKDVRDVVVSYLAKQK